MNVVTIYKSIKIVLDSLVVELNVEVVYFLSSAKITYCYISLYFSCNNHLKQFYISNKT